MAAFKKGRRRFNNVQLNSLTLPSFAKINWSLRVLGKRADGYHEIQTVLQTISLRDEIRFVRRDDPQILLTCNDPTIPTDQANLILKAVSLLQQPAGQFGADIHLTKSIPAKGGLGGASSNAATTLLGLNTLWGLNYSRRYLREISASLGADVPFFFVGGRALAEGTGTRVTELSDQPKRYLLVTTPSVGVATARAYQALKSPALTTNESTSILARSFGGASGDDRDQWSLSNDFEGVIFEIEPEIKRVKDALLEAGAQDALLAGSGSSVFGVFATDAARERAAAEVKCEPGWRLFSCDTLSRDEYFQALG